MIRDFYNLVKPGIVRGNAMTALAGFLLASNGSIDPLLLFGAIVGLSCVIASACVFNNIMDKDIDKRMKRTKKRALVTGDVSVSQALVFACVLLGAGVLVLGAFTNALTLAVALFGHFAYVVVYGYAKRTTVYGTEVGSISGAVPPVVGYVAVTNQIDSAAILLFLLLVFWQMPHFYAIGIKRKSDYAAASIPILPVKKNVYQTKIRAIVYTISFTLTVPFLTIFGYTGIIYLIVMTALGFTWLYRGVDGLKTKDDDKWAGEMFGFSLLVLTAFSVLLSLNAWLP